MFKNYFKIAIRNIVKNKTYSLINIFGLSIGIAFCILTFLFISHEWTYDSFHENAGRIYRVGIRTPDPLCPTILQEVPGIEHAVRYKPVPGIINYKDKYFSEMFTFTEPPFFRMFSFPLLKGNPLTAINNKYSVVISSKMAKKYFGDENPIGKIVSLRMRGYYLSNIDFQNFIVTGVARDVPINSSIRFDFLLPFTNRTESDLSPVDWGRRDIKTYIQVKDKVEMTDIEKKIYDIYKQNFSMQYKGHEFSDKIPLVSIVDLHFSEEGFSPKNSYILGGISLLVLLIACINYINLSIGLFSTRFREISMRKVLGAERRQLIRQILVESTVLSVIALFLSIIWVELLLPVFNSFVDRNLTLDFMTNCVTASFSLGLVLFIGIISGSYSAFYLSGLNTVCLLQNKLKFSGSNLFSKGLIVFQFSLSVFLITCAIVMSKQLLFIQKKDLGFNKEHIVIIDSGIFGWKEQQSILDKYKNELELYESVISISATTHLLGGEGTEGRPIFYKNKENFVSCMRVDYNLIKTLRLNLVEGRDFSRNFPSDWNSAIIVNESFLQKYGRIGWKLNWRNNAKIIGVVKDFNFHSLHQNIEPLILYLRGTNNIFIRIKPDNVSTTLDLLRDKWKDIAPDCPFEFYFLDEYIDNQYRAEQQWGDIINYSSIFAVFIACFGLFALASLAVSRRTKEIGIRKVLGASLYSISSLISKEFIYLVIIANVIAWPIAWYAMNKWLENFAYRIDLSWWIFVLAGLLALVIALVTVSFQAVKAARANPVDSLRYE